MENKKLIELQHAEENLKISMEEYNELQDKLEKEGYAPSDTYLGRIIRNLRQKGFFAE